MSDLYVSKYYSNLTTFLQKGWTAEEINKYFPLLESLSKEKLLELHKMCQAHMFNSTEEVDEEQAIHVLVNPNDTPKELLITALNNLIAN